MLSADGSSNAVFLPIKPVYAERIMRCQKRYEYRKVAFALPVSWIVVYASAPVKRIVGIVEITDVRTGAPTSVWESTKKAAGVPRSTFRSYFSGRHRAVAITLGRVLRLSRHVAPEDIDPRFSVPQSFRYVDGSFVRKALELACSED